MIFIGYTVVSAEQYLNLFFTIYLDIISLTIGGKDVILCMKILKRMWV